MYLGIKNTKKRVNRIGINSIRIPYGSTSISTLPLIHVSKLICTLDRLLSKAATVSWIWIFITKVQIEQSRGMCKENNWKRDGLAIKNSKTIKSG